MRSKIQKQINSKAKKTIEYLTKEFDSSSQSEALKSTNFQIPPPYAKKDMIQQLREMHGLVKEEQSKYHNEKYAALVKKVVPLRTAFGKCSDKQAKKEMAKEEFDAWFGYLESRKEELPETEYVIDEQDYGLLKENFDRFKVIHTFSHNFIGQKDSKD